MIVQLNFDSEVPIYEQLVHAIILGIATGQLSEGDSLPSVRQFGVDLGINLHTVNKSYNQLKQDGFISIHRQKGAMVNPKSYYAKNPMYLDALKAQLKTMIVEAFCRQVSQDEFNDFCSEIYNEMERGGQS